MFHSSGFFSGILCPFYEHGLCHRPHCHYRHSRRERLPPRKRPQLKTKYTKYPPASQPSVKAAGEPGTQAAISAESGEGKKEEGKRDEGQVPAVFNFYGASNETETGETRNEYGADIGTDSIAQEEPGAEVELPCYAPEVCLETVVGIRDTEVFSEREVKELPPPEVEPVTVELIAVPVETELALPTNDDITEADIFGSTDDDTPDGVAEEVVEEAVEMEEEKKGGGEVEEREAGEEEREGREEREGERREEERKEGGGAEEVAIKFQKAIETQTLTTGRKRPLTSALDYPSTAQKKKRLALPNAELYRHNSSSGVKRAPTITSNFAASLDKDSLYVGRKRMALKLKAVTIDQKSPTATRPTIPLKANSKVPTKLRQKYLDSYIDEILKVNLDPRQAYKKAEKEEAELFERCSSRMTYCSRATQTLQRLRNEAKEFLQRQGETSDSRVQANNQSGRSSNQTTPTSGRSSNQTTPTNRHPKKKPKSEPEKLKLEHESTKSSSDLGSPPLLSPTSLTPRLVERCKSVEVRVKKCVSVVSEDERAGHYITGRADTDTAVTPRAFYSTGSKTSTGLTGLGGSSKGTTEKKEKNNKMRKEWKKGKDKDAVKKSGEKYVVISSSSSEPLSPQIEKVRKKMKRRPEKVVVKKDDKILPSSKEVFVPGPSSELLSYQTMEEEVAGEEGVGREGGRGGNGGAVDTEVLKIDLFGESDSDCVALSSPCSSGEEEIMNVSFEDALRGAELGQGSKESRGRGLEGTKKSKVAQSERVGSGEMKKKGRPRLGSGEEKRKVKKAKVTLMRRREQRRSRSNSVDEPPAHFKPDSHLLVNLSDVAAAKVNSLMTSCLPSLQQLSTGSAARGGVRPSSSSSLLKPSCTVFKKAAVTLTAPVFYALMKAYLMTQEQLVENGYPMATEKVGVAAINWGGDPPPIIQPVGSNAMRHRCCRCGKNFIIYDNGKYQTVEECIHHYGRLFKVKEYGEGVVSQYSCCNERRDSGGCQVAKFHVTAGAKPREMSGYVRISPSSTTNETVYAVDCEMCYTTAGLELTRVSVVDMELQPVYEATVLPPRPIVDYNTRFSGLTARDFAPGQTVTLEEVQRKMLGLVGDDTILLGHGLESDLRTLKIIHRRVVDTAIVFPHRRGPPLKRALRNLMKDHLNKIIQDDVDGGHDSLEDARACMELMLWKTRGDLQKTTRRGAS